MRLMWILEVVKDVSPENWREFEAALIPYSPHLHEVVAEVPEEVRPLLVKRSVLTQRAKAVLVAPVGESAAAAEWYQKQANTLQAVIATSLEHAGVKLGQGGYFVGEGWKLLRVRDLKIVAPTDAETAAFGGGLMLNFQTVASAVSSRLHQ